MASSTGRASGTQHEDREDTWTLRVGGLQAGRDEARVRDALVDVRGVLDARVFHKDERAEVDVLEGQVSPDHLVHVVEEAGYDAEVYDVSGGQTERSVDLSARGA